MNINEQYKRLKQVPLFKSLSEARIKSIAFQSETYDYSAGEFVFHKDDISDCVYVILAGEVTILEPLATGDYVTIGSIKQDALVGEMAVLRNAPRATSIKAEQDSTLLAIDNDAFISIITENPSVSLFLLKSLSESLAKSNERFKAQVTK